ncbi:MAG: hypothetical protein H0V63_07075 [Burkholderiaceae bacterium]|nr:hypothetical protein [Burkholderiaceae bacterium]
MPVPTLITELSTTAASNSPAGTENASTMDDYMRTLSAFIAAVRDGTKNLEAGSVAAPALARSGDANTGLYFPATDEVALAAGGVQGLKVTATAVTAPGTITATGLIKGNNAGSGLGSITVSAAAATGGAAGDVWFQKA